MKKRANVAIVVGGIGLVVAKAAFSDPGDGSKAVPEQHRGPAFTVTSTSSAVSIIEGMAGFATVEHRPARLGRFTVDFRSDDGRPEVVERKTTKL